MLGPRIAFLVDPPPDGGPTIRTPTSRRPELPNFDVLIYHSVTTDTAVEIGDPARTIGLGVEGEHVSGVYPPLHEGSDGTIVVSATPANRPLLGLEQLLLPHGPAYVVASLDPGHPAYRRHPEPFAPRFSEL
jgi:hypothetical protein